MALSMASASISFSFHQPHHLFRTSPVSSTGSNSFLLLLFDGCCRTRISSSSGKNLQFNRAYSENREGGSTENKGFGLLDDELLRRISGAKDADEALEMVAEEHGGDECGIVEPGDCCSIIEAAFDQNNPDLALSVFYAMRLGYGQGVREKASLVEKWKWGRPDVRTYAVLVWGLAASLRVSEAIRVLSYVTRMGISSGEEVPFGKIVRCPTCMTAIAVAQPQHGVQIASCSKCRYKYELVSGNIVSIDSEEISMDISTLEKGLRFLQILKKSVPAAVHSIVVQTPEGSARTHKFATKTVELPAQEGERVTISLSAPSNVFREIGPLKFSAKSPEFGPGEPICLLNHRSDQESQLLQAPTKEGNSFFLNPSILFPALALLATGDAASGIIDPSLPKFLSIAAVASFALGSTLKGVVLPKLNQLPQKMVDLVAIRQQLLAQYDFLQTRIKDLSQAAEKEVWMLARMSQLENKIVAVGEPSYRARRSKVKRVRQNLENSLVARIELIESYAKISSMIEIEVEMDSDVLAAEAANNAESIAEQIERMMELENLEERWQIQAEANDEVERLLSSKPL